MNINSHVWRKVEIGSFLTERTGKYSPDAPQVTKLRRLEKIDFNGNIVLSDKKSKTNMIIVHSGDLVISGINVAKGAIAVYQGKEPVAATIHYSSYQFDETKIDIGYFRYLVKSEEFVSLLKDQVKGGIKTEIKPKHFLPLCFTLPDLNHQKIIVKQLHGKDTLQKSLQTQLSRQKSLLQQLRQSILQEAIEGKLTADWRRQNPVREREPNYDAKALLENIRMEKETLTRQGKVRKQQPLAPLKTDAMPFALPAGWVWCRLGEVITMIYGNGLTKAQYIEGSLYPVFGSNGILGYYNKFLTKSRVIIVGRKGSAGALRFCSTPSWTTDVAYYIEEKDYLHFEFVFQLLKSLKLEKLGKGIKPGVNRNEVYNLPIPLPPLAEQKAIVRRVETLLAVVEQLENQLSERQDRAEQLTRAALREAFG